MAAFDLIIFDCDGVLIDSEVISASVLLGALNALDVPIDFPYFAANFIGRSFPVVAQIIRDKFKVTLPEDFELNYRASLLAAFARELQPTDGIATLLARLSVPKCVATSSSPPRAARSLAITDLARYFGPHVFTASEVARGKPAPDLFLHAAARMGVPPHRCLVIEDSLIGVAAGQAAGMAVLRYTGGAHLNRADAPAVTQDGDVPAFSSWADFDEVVARMADRTDLGRT